VNINQTLKVDDIASINTSTLNTPTTLNFHHDNVSIPVNLNADRILPYSVPPVTTPPTETNLTLYHDNTVISKKLKVNTIYSTRSTNSISLNAYTNNISLNANKVIVSNILNVDNISSTSPILNIGTASPNTGVINIGNIDNPNNCDIYFYGRVHHLISTDNNGLIDELQGYINQLGI
jgi:hypothetical protein